MKNSSSGDIPTDNQQGNDLSNTSPTAEDSAHRIPSWSSDESDGESDQYGDASSDSEDSEEDDRLDTSKSSVGSRSDSTHSETKSDQKPPDENIGKATSKSVKLKVPVKDLAEIPTPTQPIEPDKTSARAKKSSGISKSGRLQVTLQPEKLRRCRRLGLKSSASWKETYLDPVRQLSTSDTTDIKTSLEQKSIGHSISIRFTRMWQTYLDEAQAAVKRDQSKYALHLIKMCRCLDLPHSAWEKTSILESTCLKKTNSYQEALDKAREVLSQSPGNVHARLAEGSALESLGEIELALVSYCQCLLHSPNSKIAKNRIESCQRQLIRIFNDIEPLGTSIAF